MLRLLSAILLSFLSAVSFSQVYHVEKTNWKDAGYKGSFPSFWNEKNILDYGGDATNTTANDSALTAAITALNGEPGVVYFPAGEYAFRNNINVNRDSIVFRGAGYDSTRLVFDLGGSLNDLISISGTLAVDTTSIVGDAVRGDSVVSVLGVSGFNVGDWVVLKMNDQAYMFSSWAYGSLSQTMQIKAINANAITFASPFRFTFSEVNGAYLQKLIPRNNVAIECLAVQRLDATAGQSSNIVFSKAVNCVVKGIESDSANFAHIEVNGSSNISITGSYFHDAFAYGGNGQGYGVLLQEGANECKVEENYFRHLRHAMLMQSGANGNVFGYNYSVEPFWTQPPFPAASAGDIVLHGNYPFMNLVEGNICQNIVIDDSHGKNGTYNTFFRNRAEGYGIFMNNNPATDTVQFIGNEMTNTSTGLNFINGNGHFQFGNNFKGNITSGNANIPDTSLYLLDYAALCPEPNWNIPVVGAPGSYNTGRIYAQSRVLEANRYASCSCVPLQSTSIPIIESDLQLYLYPNPASDFCEILLSETVVILQVDVLDVQGRKVYENTSRSKTISTEMLPTGSYFVRVITPNNVLSGRFVKN